MRQIDLIFSEMEWEDPVRQMGYKLLRYQLRKAAEALLHATTSRAALEAVAFMQGSAMDAMLAALEIEANPVAFREMFYTWVQHQSAHHNGNGHGPGSSLVSATTPGLSLHVVSTAS